MKTYLLILLCGLSVLGRQDTGSPSGLMADCPGMNRSTTFSEETKQSLSVVVVWPDFSLFGLDEKRCSLSAGGAACAAKNLDLKNRKTQVVISGYLDASFSPLVRSMTKMYLKRGRNVIILEIFPLFLRSYPIAARITKPLGELLGEFLAELMRFGLASHRLELLGASLGAHVASYAAVRYRQLTNRRPARLTGLDPAGPCFRNLPPLERFNRNAAERVDALHTNIDGLGIADAVAHVDFYANGGEFQPSMAGDFVVPCFLLCSHVRSAFYWMQAFKDPDKFTAVRCDSVASARTGNCYGSTIETNVLGPRTNFSMPGVYFLPLNEVSPYHIGKGALEARRYGVNAHLSKSALDEDMIV